MVYFVQFCSRFEPIYTGLLVFFELYKVLDLMFLQYYCGMKYLFVVFSWDKYFFIPKDAQRYAKINLRFFYFVFVKKKF